MARKASRKSKQDAFCTIRDALPFFSTGRIADPYSRWWQVCPTGDYEKDYKTGVQYARAFLPLMQIDAGQSALCWVVQSMARAKKPKKQIKALDAIATGFLNEIYRHHQETMDLLAVEIAAREAALVLLQRGHC